MRHRGLSLLGMVVTSANAAGFAPAPVYKEPPRPKVPELVKALQGTWKDTVARLPPRWAVGRQSFIRIQNSTWGYVYSINGVEQKGPRYEMVIDAKKSPATLDLVYINPGPIGGPAGMPRQIVQKGIVKVEGDTLTFCYVHGATGQRPSAFEGTPNQGLQVGGIPGRTVTLRRVK